MHINIIYSRSSPPSLKIVCVRACNIHGVPAVTSGSYRYYITNIHIHVYCCRLIAMYYDELS